MNIQDCFSIIFSLTHLSKRDCVKSVWLAREKIPGRFLRTSPLLIQRRDPGWIFLLGFLCGVCSPRDKLSKQITVKKVNIWIWLYLRSLSGESTCLDPRHIHDEIHCCCSKDLEVLLNYPHLIYEGRWHISVISRSLSKTTWDRKWEEHPVWTKLQK